MYRVLDFIDANTAVLFEVAVAILFFTFARLLHVRPVLAVAIGVAPLILAWSLGDSVTHYFIVGLMGQ